MVIIPTQLQSHSTLTGENKTGASGADSGADLGADEASTPWGQ